MMENEKIKQVGALLSQATASKEEQHQQELIAILEQHSITPDTQISPMEFLFRLFDKPCFPRGELVGITGKAKSGKTYMMSLLMACCQQEQVLALRRPGKPLSYLWIDTEQSEESTQDILRHRILPMSGGTFDQERMHVVNLRPIDWHGRLELTLAAIRHYRPDLVVIDGVRDLMGDINDWEAAQAVIEPLMQAASEGHCCIVTVIHQNKSIEDNNLRGTIGTELTNKAFEVYTCMKDENRLFSIKQDRTRKYDIIDLLYFTIGEQGLPRQVGEGTYHTSLENTTKKGNNTYAKWNQDYIITDPDGSQRVDLERVFADTLRTMPNAQYEPMKNAIMARLNMNHLQTYYELVAQAINTGIILKSRDHTGHVVYALNSGKRYGQQTSFLNDCEPL